MRLKAPAESRKAEVTQRALVHFRWMCLRVYPLSARASVDLRAFSEVVCCRQHEVGLDDGSVGQKTTRFISPQCGRRLPVRSSGFCGTSSCTRWLRGAICVGYVWCLPLAIHDQGVLGRIPSPRSGWIEVVLSVTCKHQQTLFARRFTQEQVMSRGARTCMTCPTVHLVYLPIYLLRAA